MKLTKIFVCFVFVSCTTSPVKDKENREWEDFSRLEVSTDTQESVREKLGPPVDISERIDKKLNKKIERWTYKKDNIPKLWAVFTDGVLQSTSMSVWEGEEESNLKRLLSKFTGNWKVTPEAHVNPHAMPTMCYLIDEGHGGKIEIHGYKMIVESISKWAPKMLIAKNLSKVKRPEFCIADICAEVSESSEWKSDHCNQLNDWLKQFNEKGS